MLTKTKIWIFLQNNVDLDCCSPLRQHFSQIEPCPGKKGRRKGKICRMRLTISHFYCRDNRPVLFITENTKH